MGGCHSKRDLDDLPDCVAGDAVPCAAVRAAPPRCSKAAILREPGQEQTRVERSAASCKTSFLPAAAAGDEGIRRTEDGEEPVRQAPFQQLAAPVSAWSRGGRWRSRSDLEPRLPATCSAAGAIGGRRACENMRGEALDIRVAKILGKVCAVCWTPFFHFSSKKDFRGEIHVFLELL